MKRIKYTQMQVGNIAHFYGARFLITEVVSCALSDDITMQGPQPYALNNGQWIDGKIISGYFGPTKNWNFQGNAHAIVSVE